MVGFMVKKLRMVQILNNLWLILVLFALGGFLCWKMGRPGIKRITLCDTVKTECQKADPLIGFCRKKPLCLLKAKRIQI